MPGCFVLDVAKLRSWSTRQHSCWKIGLIPRTKGRARTRETRDFLKTIVAYTRVGDKRCYDSTAWNAVAFIHFLLEFSSLTWLLTFTDITDILFFGLSLIQSWGFSVVDYFTRSVVLYTKNNILSIFSQEFLKLDVSVFVLEAFWCRLFVWLLARVGKSSKCGCKPFVRVQKVRHISETFKLLNITSSIVRVGAKFSFIIERFRWSLYGYTTSFLGKGNSNFLKFSIHIGDIGI